MTSILLLEELAHSINQRMRIAQEAPSTLDEIHIHSDGLAGIFHRLIAPGFSKRACLLNHGIQQVRSFKALSN